MSTDRARIDLTKYRERFQRKYPDRDFSAWVRTVVDEALSEASA